MSVIPPIFVELKAIGGDLSTKVNEAKGELSKLESSGSASMQKLQGAGKLAAIGIAAAFVPIAIMSVKSAMDYQTSMATIQGATQETTAQVKTIGNAFLNTMGTSTFSAQEMSAAMGPVAGVVQQVAGHALTAADALTVMHASTDLAEASGGNLTSTTADLSAVLQTYGLKVKDAGEASNTLYNASRLTGVPLDTLTQTVDKLHAKLGLASPSLADTSGLMVDLAEHGVSGSRGVMMANTALSTLMGGSKSTNDELKALGVNVYDSSGKFVGMQAALAQLTPKLALMTDQQRMAAEKALFGAGAEKGMNATILGGVAAYQTATAAVTKKNAVDTAASNQAATLKGQLHLVSASAEDLGVKFGIILIPKLQLLIKWVTEGVTWLTKHQTVAKTLGVVIGGALVLAIGAYTVSMISAAVATVAAAWPILAIIAAVAVVGVAIYEFATHWSAIWAGVQKVAGDVWAWLVGAFDGIKNAIGAAWNWVLTATDTAWTNITNALKIVLQAVFMAVTGPIGLLVMFVKDHWTQIHADTLAVWNAITAFFGTVKADVMGVFQEVWNFIVKAWSYTPLGMIIDNWGKITDFLGTIPSKVKSAFSDVGKWLEQSGKDLINGLLSGAGSILSTVGNFFLSKLPSWIVGPFKSAMGIKSPSTVMAGLGANVGAGLSNGIQGSVATLPGQLGQWINAALMADGLPSSWALPMSVLVGRESGGNPNAINLWDSNAKAGHPSQGLAQMIPGTFESNRNPGLVDNILDPVANLASAMRYIKARYGDISNVQQANALAAPKGYDAGGLWPAGTAGFNSSSGSEGVVTHTGLAVLDRLVAALEKNGSGSGLPSTVMLMDSDGSLIGRMQVVADQRVAVSQRASLDVATRDSLRALRVRG